MKFLKTGDFNGSMIRGFPKRLKMKIQKAWRKQGASDSDYEWSWYNYESILSLNIYLKLDIITNLLNFYRKKTSICLPYL